MKNICTRLNHFEKNGNYDVMAVIFDFCRKWKQYKITQDILMYIHIKFHQDPTIFYKVRILAGNSFYVWRHSRHFENRSTSNLRREALHPTLNLLVKTPSVYHLWLGRSSRHKFSGTNQNGCHCGHVGFLINVKWSMHTRRNIGKISRRLNHFETRGPWGLETLTWLYMWCNCKKINPFEYSSRGPRGLIRKCFEANSCTCNPNIVWSSNRTH